MSVTVVSITVLAMAGSTSIRFNRSGTIEPKNPANNKLKNITDAAYEMRDLGDEVIKVAAEYGITLSEDDVADGEESDLPSS